MNFNNFFEELKRRNVYKVAIAYLVSSWLILQVASILLPTFEAPLWVMQVITYILLAGFPLALLFAWIYEMTPDGLKKTGSVDAEESITSQTGQTLNRVIIGVLSLAVVILLADRFTGLGTNSSLPSNVKLNSIAVFPFEVRGKSDLQYLREGMVDLVSTKLDGIPGMNSIDPFVILAKVRNSESTVQDPYAFATISADLGAQEFLLGSIVDIGDKLQFSASKYSQKGKLLGQTTVETDDTQNLSKTIDQLVFELISDKLKTEGQEFNSLAALMTEDLEALKFYIEGERLFRTAEFADARDQYEQALALDSTFAQAWTRLEMALSWGHGQRRSSFDVKRIRQKVDRYSVELPKKWQDFHKVHRMYNYKLYKTKDEYERLINEYGESYELLNMLAEIIYHSADDFGHPENDAEPYLLKAIEYDPNNREAYIHLADIAFAKNDTSALQKYQKTFAENSFVWTKIQAQRDLLKENLSTEMALEILNNPQVLSHGLIVRNLSHTKHKIDTLAAAARRMNNVFWRGNFANLLAYMGGKEKETTDQFILKTQSFYTKEQILGWLASQATPYLSDPNFIPWSDFYPEFKENLENFSLDWWTSTPGFQAYEGFEEDVYVLKHFVEAKICLGLNDLSCYEANLNALEKFEEVENEMTSKVAKAFVMALQGTEMVLKEEFESAKSFAESSWKV